MKADVIATIGICWLLAMVAVPGSNAQTVPPECADGVDNDEDGGTDWLGTAAGAFEDWDQQCTWPGDPSEEGDDPNNCPHGANHAHTYGFGGSAGARSDTVTGGDEVGAGVVTVFETNAVDCNGDGFPSDYDGDWETGVGGGFFGYGPWANEPTCNYGLTIHGGTATVNDVVFGGNIAFVIGADDTGGPVVSTDPVSGETTCSTSGSITPGDPATDPTADPDDCLTDVYTGSGATCGAGGDGGYWVFLSGTVATETGGYVEICTPDPANPPCCPDPLPDGWRCETLPNGDVIIFGPPGGFGASNPPTAGTITA